MALYGWNNCPTATGNQIRLLCSRFSDVLADQLAGVYLHGSLAMGCFNPERSDLDLIAITTAPIPPAGKRLIIADLLRISRQPHSVEISFLTKDQLFSQRHPAPYDLHYSEMWRDAYTQDLASGNWNAFVWGTRTQFDPDLAAHFTVVCARGICLMGEPIDTVFPPVQQADYRASIAADISASLEDFVGDPVYAILNCCRTWAYVSEGRVFSKEEGGIWALQFLPEKLKETLNVALAAYRSGAENPVYSPEALATFAAEMRQRLGKLV